METMLTRLPEEAKMRQAEVVTMIEQLPENPEIEVTLRELKRQVMDWKSDSNTEESWSDTMTWPTHLAFSTSGILAITGVIIVMCYLYRKCNLPKPSVARSAVGDQQVTQSSQRNQGDAEPAVSHREVEALQGRVEQMEAEMEEVKKTLVELESL